MPDRSSPTTPMMTGRAAATLVLAGAATALGGLILGEYDFSGPLPYVAGILFGLVIGELVADVGHLRSVAVAAITASLAAGGLGLAIYISTGEGLHPFPVGGWVGIVLGAAAAAWRTGPWSLRTHAPARG